MLTTVLIANSLLIAVLAKLGGRGVGIEILLYVITFGFYGWFWAYKKQKWMNQHAGSRVGGVLGLVLWILNPIGAFVISSEVGKMYKADGREAPFSGWTGLWLLLPIVGAFVWFIKIQGALNRYWESKAAPSAMPAA